MASVRKLNPADPKSPWVVEYTDGAGKRRRKTPKSGLKKDADAIRLKIERELGDEAHVASSQTVTLGEAIKAWLKDCERRWRSGDRMAGSTYAQYQTYVRHYMPAANMLGRKLNEVTSIAMQDHLNTMSPRYAWSTIQGTHSILNLVFRFAVARKWLKVNPIREEPIRVPGEKKREKLIPSKEELRRLLEILSKPAGNQEWDHAHESRLVAVVLAMCAGLRRGEVIGLQWGDVDFDGRLISVEHSYSYQDGLKSPKTAAGRRSVAMSDPVWAVLDALRAAKGGKPSGYVLSYEGHPIQPQKLSAWIHYAVRLAGFVDEHGRNKYSLHTLRHVMVSLLIEHGVLPIHVKKIVGHASVRTTMDVYGHLFPEDQTAHVALRTVGAQFSLPMPSENPAIWDRRDKNAIFEHQLIEKQ